jgi:hypothetical protein
MYSVEGDIVVISLDDLPLQEAGAPLPFVVASDNDLLLAYETRLGDEIAVLKFVGPFAHSFGPPNDEALHGHPLAKNGLHAYGNFEVLNSPWVAAAERMNRVHPFHDPRRFAALRHFAFTFHDTMFECLALDIQLVATLPNQVGSNQKLISLLMEMLTTKIGI